MGFDEGFLKKVNFLFKASLFGFVAFILIFILMVISNFYWKVTMIIFDIFLLPLGILFFAILLCLIITGAIKLIVFLDSKIVKKPKPVPINVYEKNTVIKCENSLHSFNVSALILCGILIVAGLILFIYGDITYNKYHGSYAIANFFNMDLAQYEFMRAMGGLMGIAGILGLIFVGFRNNF